LGLSEQACRFCGTPKATRSASTSSRSGGPESRAFPTCAILWPTPTASLHNLTEPLDAWQQRRAETKERVKNGNGFGTPLTVAVRLDCQCACHTSMSSAAGSPARTSVLPAPGLASPRGPARVFGTSSPDSFATYDPATSSWRTSQLSLLEDSTSFSGTWPRAGMTRSGIASPLVPLAPLTGGTASGSLPTPTARDHKDTGDLSRVPENGLLPRVVQRMERERVWPTPRATVGGPDYARANREGSGGGDLATSVARETPGQLNPTWVEWLMGYPPGWTVSAAWETRSSRRSRSGSAAGSSRTKRK
jgi:hypothetical protein